ncbi:VOC family protein [Geodermatophilus sp. SYSU D00815]
MPTRDTAWPTGTPCWVDYGAADVAAAREFYGGLFGWEFTGGDEEYGGYLNAVRDGRMVAGLGPRVQESDPVAWTTYFATDDSAAAVDRITAAGGTVVVAPMEVAPYGVMTIALDPQGNPFGLWEAREHSGFQRHSEPGTVAWNEATFDDPESARAFYGAVFGYTFDAVEGVEGYTTFRTDERTPEYPQGGLGGPMPDIPRGWLVCFGVASADDTVARVEAQGGKVLTRPEDTPFGRFAVVEDPWGAAFEVLQDVEQG